MQSHHPSPSLFDKVGTLSSHSAVVAILSGVKTATNSSANARSLSDNEGISFSLLRSSLNVRSA